MTSLVNDSRGTRIAVGLVPALYDKVLITYPNAVTEVYSYFYSGNPCGVVTLIYSDSTKDSLISGERTA